MSNEQLLDWLEAGLTIDELDLLQRLAGAMRGAAVEEIFSAFMWARHLRQDMIPRVQAEMN
jgi:hypothetical protein